MARPTSRQRPELARKIRRRRKTSSTHSDSPALRAIPRQGKCPPHAKRRWGRDCEILWPPDHRVPATTSKHKAVPSTLHHRASRHANRNCLRQYVKARRRQPPQAFRLAAQDRKPKRSVSVQTNGRRALAWPQTRHPQKHQSTGGPDPHQCSSSTKQRLPFPAQQNPRPGSRHDEDPSDQRANRWEFGSRHSCKNKRRKDCQAQPHRLKIRSSIRA